jgi:pimeloyl-ACP methyl ester carboxylesterase
MTSIELRYFNLPGLRMHAAVAGPEAGPLVILLHGFPQFWFQWRHQIPALAEAGYRVIAPDQRGYNLTEKTPPYHIDTLVQDIVHLIDASGQREAMIAAHDWGAVVAWALAGRHPERVRKLAILNVPHPGPMGRALLGGHRRQMLKSWYVAFFQIPHLPEWMLSRSNYRPLKRALMRSARPGTFSAIDLAEYARAWAQAGALSAMIGWYRGLRVLLAPEQRRTLLKRITAPTLILWGEDDLALEVEVAEESLHWLDHGRMVRFPDVSHWIAEEIPDTVTRHLLEHFAA